MVRYHQQDIIKDKTMENIPVNKMYEQRHKFIIVALTGITGSGCSDFADLMHSEFINDDGNGWGQPEKGLIRMPEELLVAKDKRTFVFKREYETCYNYCKNYKTFEIIKYKNVLLFYMFREVAKNHPQYFETLDALTELIRYKFHHSYEEKNPFIEYELNSDISVETIVNWGYCEDLHNKFVALNDGKKIKTDVYSSIATLFFDEEFVVCAEKMYETMKSIDYFAKNFFSHRLACAIRATGNPESEYNDYKEDFTNNHIFDLVELINHIIKGYHINDSDAPRRFVIDCIRNSMEILYLIERYNAFYMIAIHNDGKEKKMVEKKVSGYAEGEKLSDIVNNIMTLSKIEAELDDFEDGRFFAPDISRCVSESELHIAFRTKEELKAEEAKDEKNVNADITSLTFYTYAEQWMKFFSLISRPGIITPSRDERCMSIAYVAKFNSGCISRQVGCAIVDKENAVQSVGWNDPPALQAPCNLRFVNEVIDEDMAVKVNGNVPYSIYSKFELEDDTVYATKDGLEGEVLDRQGFCDCLRHEIPDGVFNELKASGLNYPYCFRSRYNKYTGKKDGVPTRSLHAEENAMLRISHRGGTGLDGGTMYVTASPCVLCSKKAYQIGIKDIVYLDPYTDIAPDLVLHCGFEQPRLRVFNGAIGGSFYKLYQPFLPLKDELSIYENVFAKEGKEE